MELLHLTFKHPDKEEKTFTFETGGDTRAGYKGYYYFPNLSSEMRNLNKYLEVDIRWNNWTVIKMTLDGKYFVHTSDYKTSSSETDVEIFPIRVSVGSIISNEQLQVYRSRLAYYQRLTEKYKEIDNEH